jgi:hypothetical protein
MWWKLHRDQRFQEKIRYLDIRRNDQNGHVSGSRLWEERKKVDKKAAKDLDGFHVYPAEGRFTYCAFRIYTLGTGYRCTGNGVTVLYCIFRR